MAREKKGFDQRNRPDWLYEALPYAYVVIGVIVMASFGLPNMIGAFSGVMFVSTGVVVYTMRRVHRRELAKVRTEIAMNEQRKMANESELIHLSWCKDYESGNSVIDEQHHRLFDLGNALLNTMLKNKHSSNIATFLDAFQQHLRQHLHTEEEVLLAFKHPISAEHKSQHERLLSLAKALVSKHRRGSLEFGDVSEFVTSDLIAHHIVAEDKQHFVAQQSAPQPSAAT